jgi:hypothetical protein
MVKNVDIWNLFQPNEDGDSIISKIEAIENVRGSVLLSLARFVLETTDEYRLIDKVRVDLIKKYGETGEDGNIRVKQELVKEFNNDLADLLTKDNVFQYKIEIEALESGFTVRDVMLLKPFMEE